MTLGRVTVFGGSGFLGRHIVKRLAARGTVVRVAVRHPDDALFLKPMGNVGQIVPVYADVRDEETVARVVAGVDGVVNAVGLYVEKGRLTFAAVHEQGALHVARQAAAAGVPGLVHISGIGASRRSDSKYVRSRAVGEELVRGAFEKATILRPSVLFGPDDAFFNTLAALVRLSPIVPVFGGGKAKVQPVYVGDVAEAAVRVLDVAEAAGKTFELGGPRIYTYAELMALVVEMTGRRRLLVPIPFVIAELQAAILSLLPDPPLTRDQVKLMKYDNTASPEAPGLKDLGIEPRSVEAVVPAYLDRFRRPGRTRRRLLV